MRDLTKMADESFEEGMMELGKLMSKRNNDDDRLARNILRTMKPTIIRGLVWCEEHHMKGNDVERQICDSLIAVIWANRANLPESWFRWSQEEMQERLGRHIATMGLWLR